MNELLVFLTENCNFLFQDYGFRIIRTDNLNSPGGNAQMLLEGETMLIKITKEQGKVFLEIQKLNENNKYRWFSIDLFQELLLGNKDTNSIMNQNNISFLRTNFNRIIELFNEKNVSNTISLLDKLAIQRSKRIFS